MKFIAFLLICYLSVTFSLNIAKNMMDRKKYSKAKSKFHIKFRKTHGDYETTPTTASAAFFSEIIHVADNSYTPSGLSKDKWEVVEIVQEPSSDGQAIVVVSKTLNQIVVAFRGTIITSWKNIKTDLSVGLQPTEYFCGGCKVHNGFLMHYKSMLVDMDKAFLKALKIKPTAKIIITGHSLGGALATIYAGHIFQRWKKTYVNRVELVTYGCPRVGNRTFADFINQSLGIDRIYRVSYQLDPVTYVPLLSMGYYHVGGNSYQFSNYSHFTLITTPDQDIENPWNLLRVTNHSQYKNITTRRFYRRYIRRIFMSVKTKNKKRKTIFSGIIKKKH